MAGDQHPFFSDEPELPARRALLKQGAAALVGGGTAAILGTPLAQAQAPAQAQPPPPLPQPVAPPLNGGLLSYGVTKLESRFNVEEAAAAQAIRA